MSGKVFRSELDPVDLLRRAAYMYPEKVACVHGERRITYGELGERCWRLANGLRAAGLARGDRVATLLPNSPAMLEAHFGVPAAGAVLVTVNTRLSSAEIEYILEHSGTRVLLLDAELAPLVEPIDLAGIRVIRVDDTGAPGDPYEDFLASASPAEPERWLEDEEQTISINYTSGTTGSAEGRAVHLPRRLRERPQRGARHRPADRLGLPVDAPDVPLQRLDVPLGGHGGRRAPRHHPQGPTPS